MGANILIKFGLLDKLAFLSRPFIRWGNLSKESGAAVTTLLGSGSAGYAMLAGFYEDGFVSEREVIITVISGTFFGYLSHIPTFYLPVVLPLLGLYAGGIYIVFQIGIAFLITVIGILLGWRYLDGAVTHAQKEEVNEKVVDRWSAIRDGVSKSIPTLKKILLRVVLVYTIANLLISLNLFDEIIHYIEPVTQIFGLPPEVSTIVVVRIADVTSSITLAGELLADGSVTPIYAVGGLLVGSLFSMAVFLAKSSLPNYIAYFGPKLGTKVAIYNFMTNIMVTAIAIYVLFSFI
ncbi:nucleoside recognition domain-containing protein [Methanonatronarchaeum thermophilum]|uniref:nucleoside recognition domain-containing protein n=1 Tax=Methanonatronarchaeum thermophilum TaxID=1927129 RepID=UPI001F24499A|nr:nucleoside recognition domain-containing protein [Methanonatronarchaeum thermophilum]